MKWEMLFQYIAFMLTSFFYSVDLCSACPCMAHHPQYQFCNADYVIKATITDTHLRLDLEAPLFDRIFYNLTVHKVFKDSRHYPIRTNAIIFSTNPNHDSCGITLPVGETYLISGHARLNGLSVSACDWVEPYHDLSFIQNMGVNGIYEDNCNCVDSMPEDYNDACHDRYGILYEYYDKICRWRVDMTQRACNMDFL